MALLSVISPDSVRENPSIIKPIYKSPQSHSTRAGKDIAAIIIGYDIRLESI